MDSQEDVLVQQQLQEAGKLPRHIAIIMDGDRRWATEQNLPRTEGHRHGREAAREVIRTSAQLGVNHLTLYTFSTENWTRPKTEVDTLMRWLRESLRDEIPELHQNNVRLQAIGNVDELPRSVRLALRRALKQTAQNTGLQLNLALNYGGRFELVNACRKLAAAALAGDILPEDIDEGSISSALYTAGTPDPDLIIRPSGEMRLSNFLTWQSVYAEIWFTPVYWPDFRREHLYEAIRAYQQRQRRFGL